MEHNNRNFDEIITKDSFLIFENKTTPYVRPKKLRPRVGHIIAIAVLLCGALLSPDSVMAVVSLVTVIGMTSVAVIYFVHLPIKTLISDRKVVAAVGQKTGRSKEIGRGEHQSHSS